VNNPQQVTTISGAIRKRLPEIEQRMYEGERQIDIVTQLNKDGIKVSLKDFRQLLSRARKARKKQQEQQTPESSIIADKSKPQNIVGLDSPKPAVVSQLAETQRKPAERKQSEKMSISDLEDLLKNPIDLDKM
jgi:nucleoid DNA-binding protein